MRIEMIVKYEMYLEQEEFELLYQYTGDEVAYGYSTINEDGQELVKVILTEEQLNEVDDLLHVAAYKVEEEFGYTAAGRIYDLAGMIYAANAWN
jgi:hypothetical protein